MWLWPQQGTVLPKYEVLIVASVMIHVFHNMTSVGKRPAQILKLEVGTPPEC